jgi:alpha-glucosidase
MVEATRLGLSRAHPERRPFVLTRSNHLCGARLAATWTGDNQSRWEDLGWAIPMVLNLGLSGQPFAGPDAGGFYGDPSPELFARWFELAALLPFFRGHSEKSSCRKEPWAFGARIEACTRAAIERRMRLLPYLYTVFREAHEDGSPVARPLFLADPADPELRDVDDSFLLGADLLVAPMLAAGLERRDVLLPRGGWYAFPGGGLRIGERIARAAAPLGVLPLFARAGAVLPVYDESPQHTGQGAPLALHVFLDAEARALGRLFQDPGDGAEDAPPAWRDVRYEARVERGRFRLAERCAGTWTAGERVQRVVVHGFPAGAGARVYSPDEALGRA